nr:MAG TPA: hypothetical protein [Caudoviricetes sp.]
MYILNSSSSTNAPHAFNVLVLEPRGLWPEAMFFSWLRKQAGLLCLPTRSIKQTI